MTRFMLTAGLVLAFAGEVARGQDPVILDESVVPASGIRQRHSIAPLFCPRPAPVYPDCPPIAPTDPTMPPAVTPPDLSGLTTPFATQTGAGGLQGRSFNESFDGDFGGIFYRKNVTTTQIVQRQTGTRQVVTFLPPTQPGGPPIRVVTTVPVFGNVAVPVTQQVLVPVPGRYSGITITDNDSPRPVDRFYFNYSYYDGIGAQLNPGFGNITQNRPMIGFEKTFLNGNASIGMRLPFIDLNGPPGVADNSVGDLIILSKFAFINDPEGDVVSAGLIVTAPTGAAGGFLSDGTPVPHSVLFQPWLGFVAVFERMYVQGITSMIVPTDNRDILMMGNSVGVGYWLYRADGDRLINGVIPIMEVHIRTPFNHRDINGEVFLQDMVNITGGLHVRFPRATIGGGVCVPVLAPRPWNVEAIANFTYRF